MVVNQGKKTTQTRTLQTRQAIANGAIKVLASEGVAGLTHRAVAQAAGVSLASTTYHFESKGAILADTSRILLTEYLSAFEKLELRIQSGLEPNIHSLNDLIARVVLNAVGRDRIRSRAWCELMLQGGRNTEDQDLASEWYAQIDMIWHSIAKHLGSKDPKREGRTASDRVVGLMFLLHPFEKSQTNIEAMLCGRIDLPSLLLEGLDEEYPQTEDQSKNAVSKDNKRSNNTRLNITKAAIDVLIEEGATAVSYRTVAEKSGMVRSGPGYYFRSIDELLEAAQATLLEQAKARYREGLHSPDAKKGSKKQLIDITTAIFLREVYEFSRENLGYYSVWMSAINNKHLRLALAHFVRDQHNAWLRRLSEVSQKKVKKNSPLNIQALFVGKLIRSITSGANTIMLSNAREDFASEINQAISL